MRTGVIFQKSLREVSRDRTGLVLTLLTAPVFVLLYALVLSPVDAPNTVGISDPALDAVLAPVFTVVSSDDFERDVRQGEIVFGVSVTEDVVRIVGDGTSPEFALGLPKLQALLLTSDAAKRGTTLQQLQVDTVGRSGERSRFDLYVPNLLIFALIMLVFSSALPIARETERGTLGRLGTTLVTPAEILLGMTAAQLVLGTISVALTLVVAILCGFHADGSAPLLFAISLATGVACVSMGVLVAGVSRTVLQAFLVASACMFLLVLFSGLVFPVPEFALLELLPTVHAVEALAAVLNLDAGFDDVKLPLAKLVGLAVLFFLLGWARFAQLHRNQLTRRA